MDEQNPTGAQSPLNAPTGIPPESEAPQEEGIPWLKYGMVLFFALAVVNIGLFYFYLSGNKKPKGVEEKVEVKDEEGFSITKAEQTISKEGYSITFSNPRY